jgi:hypothetical protein
MSAVYECIVYECSVSAVYECSTSMSAVYLRKGVPHALPACIYPHHLREEELVCDGIQRIDDGGWDPADR